MFIGDPQPGFYRTRLIRGGIMVPVRFWYGPPIVDGEELDRSYRLNVEVNGRTDFVTEDGTRELLDPFEVWPFCQPITQREYQFMHQRIDWAQRYEPGHPAANPTTPIDLGTLPPRF